MTNTTGHMIRPGDRIRFNAKAQTVTSVSRIRTNAGTFFEVNMVDAAGATDSVQIMADTRLEMA